MKRHILYIGAVALCLGLSSCDEDFTDWASPQHNDQQPMAGAVAAIAAAGADDDVVKADAADTVNIINLTGFSDASITSGTVSEVILNGTNTVPFTSADGKTIRVATAQLDSVVKEVYQSQASTKRELTLSLNVAAKNAKGTSFSVKSNEVAAAYTPGPTPEVESAYYLVGGFNNWVLDKSVPMTAKGDGTFQATVEVTAGDCYWKIFGAKAVAAADWSQGLGCVTNGSTATSDFIKWNDGAEAQSMMIKEAGTYIITFDAVNFRYSVAPKVAELYFTGSNYNWGGSAADWHALTPVNGRDGEFWTMVYADAGEQLKFAPQAGWGGDFAGTVAGDEAASGAAPEGGNLTIAKAGWYLLYVNATTQAVEVFQPNVYMIGDCMGNWDETAEASKFTVPTTRDGEFVSPAFAADGDMRVYVKPKADVEWWRTEFIVIDGKIAFRGNGGDQERVAAKAGQKLHLNFTAGTGSVK